MPGPAASASISAHPGIITALRTTAITITRPATSIVIIQGGIITTITGTTITAEPNGGAGEEEAPNTGPFLLAIASAAPNTAPHNDPRHDQAHRFVNVCATVHAFCFWPDRRGAAKMGRG